MVSDWKLCPTCSQPCQYKDGIRCMAFICAKKNSQGNQQQMNQNAFDTLFGAMGIKPGDSGYNSIINAFCGKAV